MSSGKRIGLVSLAAAATLTLVPGIADAASTTISQEPAAVEHNAHNDSKCEIPPQVHQAEVEAGALLEGRRHRHRRCPRHGGLRAAEIRRVPSAVAMRQ